MAANLEMEMIESKFDGAWNELEKESFHCWSLLCEEFFVTKQVMDPIALGKSRCLCFKSSLSSAADIAGEKGLLTGWSKMLCCLQTCSINNIACGVMDNMFLGHSHLEDIKFEGNEGAFVKDTKMLAHCLCFGYGLSPISPLLAGYSKVGCLEMKQSSDGEMCEKGQYLRSDVKMCCFMQRDVCLPSTDVGIACCGINLFGPAGAVSRSKPLAALFGK